MVWGSTHINPYWIPGQFSLESLCIVKGGRQSDDMLPDWCRELELASWALNLWFWLNILCAAKWLATRLELWWFGFISMWQWPFHTSGECSAWLPMRYISDDDCWGVMKGEECILVGSWPDGWLLRQSADSWWCGYSFGGIIDPPIPMGAPSEGTWDGGKPCRFITESGVDPPWCLCKSCCFTSFLYFERRFWNHILICNENLMNK